jgi:hypothetical protein
VWHFKNAFCVVASLFHLCKEFFRKIPPLLEKGGKFSHSNFSAFYPLTSAKA